MTLLKCRACGAAMEPNVGKLLDHINYQHVTSNKMPLEFVNAILILFYGKAVDIRKLRKFQNETNALFQEAGKTTIQVSDQALEGAIVQ